MKRVDSWSSPDRYQMPEPVALPDVPDVPDVPEAYGAEPPVAAEPPEYDDSRATTADEPAEADAVVELPGMEIPLPGSDETESLRIPPVSVHINRGFDVSSRDREELRRALEHLQRRMRAEMRRRELRRIF
jgi:hypothetical protein